jgi:hypothetical protein
MRKREALYRFSIDEEKSIVSMYVDQTMSITKIAKELHTDRDTISRLLCRYNVAQRPLGSHLRKYNINENYFDNIDAEDKAYFLGLLCADGCNHIGKRKFVDIALQEEDKALLDEFSKKLYGVSNLYFLAKRKENHKNQWKLSMHSKNISDKLYSVGCISRKSLTLTFPIFLTEPELQRHFIRGYFDGDGSISSCPRKGKPNSLDWDWSIVSTNDFCGSVIDIVTTTLNIYCTKRLSDPKINNITHKMEISGSNQILKIMEWLYKDATIFLIRKHNKYLELKEYVAKTTESIKGRRWSDEQIEQIIDLYNSGLKQCDIAKLLNKSTYSISDLFITRKIKELAKAHNKQ